MKNNPLKIKNKLYQADWMETRPMGIISKSDTYFLQLSNKILTIIESKMSDEIISVEIKRKIAIRIASYFEDVISKFGLWQAFVNIHHRMYGKYLPFYKLSEDDYFPDEINQRDVQFLIWAYLQRENIDNSQDGKFINAENPLIELVSIEIYLVLDSEYETAPENESIFRMLYHTDYISDFFYFREVLSWIHYDSYLSMTYPLNRMSDEIDDLENSKHEEFFRQNEEILEYTIEKSSIFNSNCSPLAIKAKDLLAELVENPEHKAIIKAVDYRNYGIFKIVSHDDKELRVKNENNPNEILSVSMDSMQNQPPLDTNNIITCGLVYFNGIWQVNGMASFGYDDGATKTEDKKELKLENAKFAYKATMKLTKNKPIQYFKNADGLRKFLLKLFPGSNPENLFPSDFESETNIVLFTHPELGIMYFPEIALYLKDKDNPCYNKSEAANKGIGILAGGYRAPKQLIDYIIENKLSVDFSVNSLHGQEHGRKIVQENIDFIVRFFQPEIF